MLVGYARVSTQEQDLALQLDALRTAGCEKIYEEKSSGAQRERPALQAALTYMRQGDTLVVWKPGLTHEVRWAQSGERTG
jgi:DNA invertase Pin-like site-specific DNA recombinase